MLVHDPNNPLALNAEIERLQAELAAARHPCKAAMEELAAYKACLVVYANRDNWGCTTHTHNLDCESDSEWCCLDEWRGPVGVHGFEMAQECLAKHKGVYPAWLRNRHDTEQ